MAHPPTPSSPCQRILRELVEPDFTYERLCIQGIHDVGTDAVRQDKLEGKIDSLTTLVTQLAMNQHKPPITRVCGICTSRDHYSDVCPSLMEPRTSDHIEAYAANIYNNRPQQQQIYDPSLSRYIPDDNAEHVVPKETRASIQEQECSIQNMTIQMGYMATSLNTLQSHNSYKLPSQNVLNPQNVTAITLSKNMEEVDKETLDTIRKIEVNIPLLEEIKQIQIYAKFLKDVCTHKRKLKGNERINMGRNVSALIDAMDLNCTNTCFVGIIQQSELLVQVQAATKPMSATLFPFVLQTPDWAFPFEMICDVVAYAFGSLTSSVHESGSFISLLLYIYCTCPITFADIFVWIF
ncbi:hypothetical protein Lal_00018480 [Lupinus albus]|nr:hypothetical protein Lal_00018480 [Lupinus albus]